jgi:hypothetical protein
VCLLDFCRCFTSLTINIPIEEVRRSKVLLEGGEKEKKELAEQMQLLQSK